MNILKFVILFICFFSFQLYSDMTSDVFNQIPKDWTGREEFKKLFEKYKEDPNIINYLDSERDSFLSYACFMSNVEIVEYLLKKGSNPNLKNIYAITPLKYAIQNGNNINKENIEIVKLLLDYKANMDQTDDRGYNSLMIAMLSYNAALIKDDSVIKLLIDNGANINTETDLTYLLSSSIYCGSLNNVKNLIDHKANVYYYDEHGNNALLDAVSSNSVDMVKLVLNYDFDINSQTKSVYKAHPNIYGKTGLIISVEKVNYEIVEFLLEKGANPDLKDCFDNAALHYAVWQKNKKIVDLLLKNKASVNIVSKGIKILTICSTSKTKYKTPLEIAKHLKDKEIIKLLKKYGAK